MARSNKISMGSAFSRPSALLHAFLVVALVALQLAGLIGPLTPAQAAPGESCFTVSDGDDHLYRYNYDGPSYEDIGFNGAGVTRIEAISWDPVNSILYAMDRGQLGTLNQTNGLFTPIGADSGFDMDGLALDPFTGTMYGAIRRADGQSGAGGVYDDLATIGITTGAVTVVGPISSPVDDEGDALYDVDDLAFDPTTGSLWGVANAGGEDTLITINKNTGAVIQSVGEFGVLDMEGLSWNDIGGLRGTTGAGADLYDIDPITAVASNPIALSPGSDFESLGCYRVAGPLSNTITGTVFLDADVNAAFGAGDTGTSGHTLSLWRDVNGDGFLTVADDVTFDGLLTAADILATTSSNGLGFYSFAVGASGAFIVEVVTGTLPAGSRLTTVALRTIDFGTSYGQTDPDNDFGYTVPAVALTKSTSTPLIDSGDTAAYSYGLENTGTEAFPAANVTVADDTCAPVTGPTSGDANSNNVLDPGETWVYTCSTALNQDTTNTATATVVPAFGPDLVENDTAFVDVRPSIVVTKTEGVASIAEPGGTVTFTIDVENTSLESVDLTALTDSDFGNLFTATNTTCATTTILAGATYSCSFDGVVAGDASGPSHANTATATAEDDEGNSVNANDGATVTFTDALPTVVVTKTPGVASIAEPGGTVTFTIDVENTSVEPVDLTTLTDTDFGNLFTATNTTCATTTIGIGATYSCTFDGTVSGDASGPDHSNTATGTVEDNEGNPVSDNDDAIVSFTDVLPTITVTKTASLTTVPAAGGAVTFTVRVDNTSVEAVTLTTLSDSVYGNVANALNPLIDATTCSLPQAIGVGGFHQCTFTATVSGTPGGSELDVVTATATDNELNPAVDTDDATVTFAAGTIGDFVWLDLDGDGAQDGGAEAGITGIDVQLYLDADSSGTVTPGDSLLGTETTDGSGAYDFTGLAAGDYVVVPDTSATLAVYNLTGGADPTAVALGVDEDFNGADFGYQPTGSIGDFVWLDFDGDGIQDGGAEIGIAGVTVDLYVDADSSGTVTLGDTLVGTETTDGSGAYDLLNLLPGDYVVTVPDAGGAIPPSMLTGGADPTGVSLGMGQDYNDADFGYQPTGSIGDFVWLDLDGDGVQDGGAEAGIAGVTVDLYADNDSSGTVTLGDALVGTDTTDGTGTYDFADLVPGDYVVTVTDTGGVIPPSNLTGGSDPTAVSLAANQDYNTADFGYQPTGSIGDFVWLDLDGDGVQDGGAEAGIAGVTVDLYLDADSSGTVTLGDTLVGTDTTDGSGTYDFNDLVSGDYVVTVTDTGAVIPPSTLTGGTDPDAVALAAGEDYNDADFGYESFVTVGDRVWLDVNGDGIQDGAELMGLSAVTVNLVDPGPDTTPGTLDDIVIDTDTTDAAGAYLLTGPAGTYVVEFSDLPAGYILSPIDQGSDDALDSDVDPATAFTAPLTLTGGQTDVTVDAGAFDPALIGDRVFVDLDEDGVFDPGEGIPNVTVTLSDGQTTVTDADGFYQFAAVAGSYTVTVDEADPDFPASALQTVGTNPAPAVVTAGQVLDTVDFGYIIAGPGILLEKDPATQTVLVGSDVTFTITVTNIGNVDLTGVVVTDALAPVCDSTIGALARGASISYDCTVTGVLVDFTNSATATGTPPIGADVTSTDTAAVDVVDPGITITKDPATQTILTGSNATFSITVTNTGDVDLTNIAVTDPLVPACDNPVGALAAGGSITYPCSAVAVAADFTNTATVNADGPLGALPPVSDTADVIVLEATLAGRVWLDLNGDAAQDVGEPGAGGVPIDLLDGSLTVVASMLTDGNGDYSFGGLDSDTYTVRVDATVLPAGSVATADPDGTLDDQTAQAVVLGDAITGLDFGYQPPATITGLVFVDDDGDAFQDPGELPIAGVTVIVTDGSGVPVAIVTDAGGMYSAGVVPGSVTVDVDDPTVPADHVLTTANDPQVVAAIAGQVVTAPDIGYQPPTVDISLTKVSSEGNVQAGDQAEWILTIANAGTVVALGPITLTDDLPDGLTYVSSSGTGWTCAVAGLVVTCDHPGPLAVGSELEVRIVTDVAADLTGTVNNEAVVSMPGDFNVLNNTAVAGVGLLPATGFNLTDALTWSLLSLLLGAGLILVTHRRDEDQDLAKNN